MVIDETERIISPMLDKAKLQFGFECNTYNGIVML